MINILKKFFDKEENLNNVNTNHNLELLCGLMVEAANTDGFIDEKEIKKINSSLVNTFQEEPEDVKSVLNKAIDSKHNSKSLYYYTSKINKNYTKEKKVLLIQTLWEIILSDGEIHDYESSLIRRLAGLLYISDVEAGNAKKTALNNITNK